MARARAKKTIVGCQNAIRWLKIQRLWRRGRRTLLGAVTFMAIFGAIGAVGAMELGADLKSGCLRTVALLAIAAFGVWSMGRN
ncbi:MAG: hypothetical protein LBK75_11240 [Oscillospiraceae bacterium]|nr:hypothetical protein [Oscillospiraceae bacterium]